METVDFIFQLLMYTCLLGVSICVMAYGIVGLRMNRDIKPPKKNEDHNSRRQRL